MRRFLEYNVTTGRILCEVTAEAKPENANGHEFYELENGMNLNWNEWIIRDDELVRYRESATERRERLELERQARERAARRLRDIKEDFNSAQLEGDEEKMRALQAEYRKLKALL